MRQTKRPHCAGKSRLWSSLGDIYRIPTLFRFGHSVPVLLTLMFRNLVPAGGPVVDGPHTDAWGTIPSCFINNHVSSLEQIWCFGDRNHIFRVCDVTSQRRDPAERTKRANGSCDDSLRLTPRSGWRQLHAQETPAAPPTRRSSLRTRFHQGQPSVQGPDPDRGRPMTPDLQARDIILSSSKSNPHIYCSRVTSQ